MANLKDLKIRISSVKSTQKITKAMKMVAASKLRRAQERAEEARSYTEKMGRMLKELAASTSMDTAPVLLTGRRNEEDRAVDKTHLIVVATSDRGLCGGFNGSIVRAVKRRIVELHDHGKEVKMIVVGKKGYDLLKGQYKHIILERRLASEKKFPDYEDSESIADAVINLFETEEIDSCSIVYNTFISAISQEVTWQKLIPLDIAVSKDAEPVHPAGASSVYEYEPNEEKILSALLPRNIAVQTYHAMLESAASEQGARMSAMDNATRNAGDMINGLTLVYNRTRQAAITTELTEIISGAEAL